LRESTFGRAPSKETPFATFLVPTKAQ
jgi:hypothetical protein